MKKLFWMNLLFGLGVLSPSFADAATFSPTTSAQLLADLTTAASNGEDNTINLAASTTYSTADAGGTFIYASGGSNSLTIAGAGAGSTVLDGGSALQVMSLTGASVSVTLSGVTIQNGASAVVGGGLLVAAAQANIQNCAFSHNTVTAADGGGAYVTTTGNLTFSNNSVSDNTAAGAGGDGGGVALVATGGGSVLTVDGNSFTGNSSAAAGYGGVLAVSSGSASFTNNTVTSNTSVATNGGGLLNVTGGNATLSGNTISNNTVSAGGIGGFSVNVTGEIAFSNNSVQGNTARDSIGGVVIISTAGTVNATGNTLSGNAVTAASMSYGGGYLSASGNVTFSNNTVSDNSTTDQVGGVRVVSSTGSSTVTGNTIQGNEASQVAGILASSATGMNFSQNLVLSNVATTSFGGVLLNNSASGDVQFSNNLVAGNTAVSLSSGVFIKDGSSGAASTFSFLNNTVTNNTLSAGALAGVYATAVDSSITMNVYNNILLGNTNDGTPGTGEDAYFINAASNLQVFNNDIGELCFSAPASCDPSTLGADAGNNLSAVDPVFIDAAAGNYRLQASSTLIDVGDVSAPGLPTTDIIGNPRSFLTIPDIGAYEAVPEISSSSTSVDFGSVSTNDASTVVITLSNNGSYDMQVTGLNLSDTANFALQTGAGDNPCGGTNFQIASGDSCTLGIEFGPDSEGSLSGTLDIISDAPATPTYTVNLTGVGTAAGGGCALQGGGAHYGALWTFLLPLVALQARKKRAN